MQNSKGLRHSKMRQNEKNGARTLFFLVYVSFTLIIIHNQWNSGLIYRFSFFRSSFFGQRLCFLVVTAFEITRTGAHTPTCISCSIIFLSRLRMQTATSPPTSPPITMVTTIANVPTPVCATVPKCKFSDVGVRAAPSPLRCTVQLSSRPSSSKCMYFVNSYFFRFSILNPYSYVEEMVVVDVILFVCLFGWVCLLFDLRYFYWLSVSLGITFYIIYGIKIQ